MKFFDSIKNLFKKKEPVVIINTEALQKRYDKERKRQIKRLGEKYLCHKNNFVKRKSPFCTNTRFADTY